MSKASTTKKAHATDLCIGRSPISLCAVVVLIGNRFEPDGFALCCRCDRDVGEGVIRCCAVPVLYTRSAFDHVSLANDACRLTSFLVVSSALSDQQNLTARMNMPVKLCTRAVRRHGDAGIESAVSNIEFAEPDIARVIFSVRQFTFGEA